MPRRDPTALGIARQDVPRGRQMEHGYGQRMGDHVVDLAGDPTPLVRGRLAGKVRLSGCCCVRWPRTESQTGTSARAHSNAIGQEYQPVSCSTPPALKVGVPSQKKPSMQPSSSALSRRVRV
jgi:hypothetical protein